MSSPPRFSVGQLLGQGGSALVYEAFDHVAQRHVALKILHDVDPIAVERLEREARTALAINHPNVRVTLDCGRLDDGRPFVAMELLAGETLRAHFRRRPRLDAEATIEIAVQMLAGLEAAHSRGVLHRDIKPENVFLEWDASYEHDHYDPACLRVKLLDFGVCRNISDPIDDRTLTLAGYVVGTPGYLAPEQAYGERGLDARVDLFAVGLVMYEALTGRAAYTTMCTRELEAALSRPLPPLRERDASISPHLERIVAIATDPEPSFRYGSAASFQHDLLQARTAMRRGNARVRVA